MSFASLTKGSVISSLIFPLFLFIAGGVSLQAQLSTGTISGTVKDQSEAVLPGATVTVTNVETGITRIVESEGNGQYRVPNLIPGSYEVQAESAGFQTGVRSGITLSVGRQAVVDITLRVGDVAERVTVTGEAPLIETTTATVSGVVEQQQMRDIPLNSRSFLELVPLQTGATFTETAGNSAVQGFGKRLSIVGARYNQNSFLLDGADINDMSQ
ncbi:MAG: carboxypeptidase-like regulatory domain-containing protein, partial [Acidobacteria bacterium]|nr:carboxypeptidase-like regulatory domain-containing protein [Acidobacteriota bacterium]